LANLDSQGETGDGARAGESTKRHHPGAILPENGAQENGAIHGHARGGTIFPQLASNQPLADFLLHKSIAQRHFFAKRVSIFRATTHSSAEDNKGVMPGPRKDRKAEIAT